MRMSIAQPLSRRRFLRSAGIGDDGPDVAEIFRQRLRREVRQGTYVLHFAMSGEEALDTLVDGVRPELIVIRSDIKCRGWTAHFAVETKARHPPAAGHDSDRVWRLRAPTASR